MAGLIAEPIDVESIMKNGVSGFKLVMEVKGISQKAVKGRITGRLAGKYPLKANKVEVMSISSIGKDKSRGLTEFRVETFIPLEAFTVNNITQKVTDIFDDVGMGI